MQETWVGSLGWKDPLEKGKATHSNILAWRIPWGCKESDTTERLSLSWGQVALQISTPENTQWFQLPSSFGSGSSDEP